MLAIRTDLSGQCQCSLLTHQLLPLELFSCLNPFIVVKFRLTNFSKKSVLYSFKEHEDAHLLDTGLELVGSFVYNSVTYKELM